MTSPLPYDLCLKLKMAGWPQQLRWYGVDGIEVRDEEGQNSIVSPSLEELIEAVLVIGGDHPYCGLGGPDPTHPGEEWTSTGATGFGRGSTPKIAVATLWLKLQEAVTDKSA